MVPTANDTMSVTTRAAPRNFLILFNLLAETDINGVAVVLDQNTVRFKFLWMKAGGKPSLEQYNMSRPIGQAVSGFVTSDQGTDAGLTHPLNG
jgi:hypothetical protein